MTKQILRTVTFTLAALFLVLLNASQSEAEDAYPEPQIITTQYGDKIKVIATTKERKEYRLISILEAKKDVIIPETIDGEHKITEVDLNNYEKINYYRTIPYCKSVTHLHLPKTIKVVDVYPEVDFCSQSRNPFCHLPNLSVITVDTENPFYMAWDGKLYRKDNQALLAVAPAVSGTVTIEKEIPYINEKGICVLDKVSAFDVEKGNPSYKTAKGVLFTKDGKELFCYPKNKKTKKYVVPKGVNEICSEAFIRAKHIREVTLPSSMRVIHSSAFALSSLRKIKLNNKLKKIWYYAFYGTKLKCIKLPSSLREMNISYIPVKKLVLPKKLGEVTVSRDDDSGDTEGLDSIETLVIKNPALDLTHINYYEHIGYSLSDKTVYAYKGSLPYRQIKEWNKKHNHIKLKALKGKVYKTPKAAGKIDTSWYSEEKDTLYIKTPAQLAGLSYLSRKKNVFFSEQTIVLQNNLDMKKYKNFYPIEFFCGIFDGNGKTIRNLTIYQLQDRVGLFKRIVSSTPTIKNLSVHGSVTGGNYTGGIVGDGSNDVLYNCSFKGKVVGYGYFGKLAGNNKPFY